MNTISRACSMDHKTTSLLSYSRVQEATDRSSCFCALWMQMDGKLHSTSSLFSSLARATDFTKMTTCSDVAAQLCSLANLQHSTAREGAA